MATDLLLGVGAAALLPGTTALTLAEHHPAANPGFQLSVTVDGGVVTSADPRVGLMHRSAEKLFESRDLRQALALADRHDWLSALSTEVGVALTFEKALGIIPPERATWIRTVLAEANRITATLAFLAPVAGPVRASAEAVREEFVTVQEIVTGARVHPGFTRIGGVAAPIDEAGVDALRRALAALDALVPDLIDAVSTYCAPYAGLAVLTREQAIDYGTSGPVGRASGLDLDLRRDDPYLAYGDLAAQLDVVGRTEGDVAARYQVLVGQLPVSARLARACLEELDRLGAGPIDVPLPKVIRLPEITAYTWIEGPLGISGCLVVGSGEKTPWRMKIRSASFATMQAMTVALVGTPMPDSAEDSPDTRYLSAAVMSFPLVIGDVDR